MADKFLKLEQLQHYHDKVKEAFVEKEEGKQLSTNDFTDDYKNRLDAEEGFEGTYESLTGKPTIDDHEIQSSNTAESLGLAKATDIPGVATTLAAGTVKPDGTTITVELDGTIKVSELESYAKKTELPGLATKEKEGLVKPDGTTVDVTEEGVLSAKLPDVSDMETKTNATKTYATKVELETYAKSDQVSEDIEAAKEEVLAEAKAAVSGAYVPKGSVTFTELPTPSKETLGFVYDVSEQFTTDEKFRTPSQVYPAGTNVVVVDDGGESYKLDVLAGYTDYSAFMLKADVTAITDAEIDALFTPAE